MLGKLRQGSQLDFGFVIYTVEAMRPSQMTHMITLSGSHEKICAHQSFPAPHSQTLGEGVLFNSIFHPIIFSCTGQTPCLPGRCHQRTKTSFCLNPVAPKEEIVPLTCYCFDTIWPQVAEIMTVNCNSLN